MTSGSATDDTSRTGVKVSATAETSKILIVDDLPEKFLVYESILEELGQTLVYATSGAEALKAVLRDEFAVILLDVNMPGMDGFEAASLIRSRRRSSATPIIFLTAWADEFRIAQGYASGAVDYIPTPVVPEILRAKVRVFVELFGMRRLTARQAEEQAKKVVAEEAARRFAFLAGAGDRLNRSLDFDTTLATFAEVSIPYLADFVTVRLDAQVDRGAVSACAWQDAGGETRFHGDGGCQWLDDLADDLSIARAAPILIASAPDIADAPSLIGGSLLLLPLATRGRRLGAVAFARGPSRAAFQEADVTLVHDIVNRGAVALENALLVQTIRETDRRKDEFIATLAHELRNPLAPVRNAVEILNQVDVNDAHVQRCRSIIDRQVRQLTRLVDDLLDVSRINSGKIELRRERVEVPAVIERAVEISRAAIEEAEHELSVSLSDETLMLDVDPVRIAQVVANLLNNAAKYTDAGGRIELTAAGGDDDVLITVKDNGVGIPKDRLSDVFEMFTQVENDQYRAQGGLGVGLSLARRLVELHGGSISARSEGLGFGSEFVVRLPLAAATEAPLPHRSVPIDKRPASEALKILVVDDNRDSAESLGLLLKLRGHRVSTAFDGRMGLAAAAETRPDIVFLDLGMPEMSGYEVAAQLKQDESFRDTILVALTGWGQDEDRRRTSKAGFHFHCTKPIPVEELHAVIDLGQAARKVAAQT